MRIIYRAENIIDANLVKGSLEQEGIPAYVAGAYLTGAAGQLPVSDLVAVMVADADLVRAEPIVRDLDAALRHAREESVKLPRGPLAEGAV
ncbi:MAG: DUF2007 domain-containing protein [Candidatus Dormibacteria bacterium]